MAAGGATERPRTLYRSMSRATKPDAFASSTKSRKNAAPAGFFRANSRSPAEPMKPPVEDACAGQFFQIGQQPRLKAGERAQLAA